MHESVQQQRHILKINCSADGTWRAWLTETASQEAKVSHPSLTFYQASLSAVPALFVGFICQEGSQLVRSCALVQYDSAFAVVLSASAQVQCTHEHVEQRMLAE